jgi:hypothetical protein
MSETMKPLEQFSERKAEILKFAHVLKQIAEERNDKDAAAILERFEHRFDENKFLVVTVGEFKRGKSTLINALVGRSVCPVRVTPRTARLTRLRAASDANEYAEVHFRVEREPERIPLSKARLEDLVAHEGVRLSEVETVDVYLHAPGTLLDDGVVFVDTPGLESLFKDHDRITREYLPRADLVIFCLSATQPLGAKERDFLLAYRFLLPKILITVNHIDTVPLDEREETMEFIRRHLQEEVFGSSATDLPLCPVSARDALSALQKGDSQAVAASGLTAVITRIAGVLAEERGRPILEAVATGQRDVALGLAKQVAAERVTRESHTSDLREHHATLTRILAERTSALQKRVMDDVEEQCEDLAGKAVGRIEEWRANLKEKVSELIRGYANEADCRKQLPRELADVLQEWLTEYDNQLRARFKRVSREAMDQCRREFEEMENEAARVLATGKARLRLVEIATGVDALSDLNAVTNCLGGPIGGYGLASSAIEPAFEIPRGVKLLTVGALAASVVATFGGPVGWGLAIVGWLAVVIANVARGPWQGRVMAQMSKAIDDEIVPKAQTAVTTEIWSFGRAFQDYVSAHIQAVHTRLAEVLSVLTSEVAAHHDAALEKIRALQDIENRLKQVATDIDAFIGNDARAQPPSAGEAAAQS